MSTQKNIPSSLEPYLHLPRELSLTLLTNSLGCSASWLAARFVGASLADDGPDGYAPCVILVSWLRDDGFWKTEIKRATGLDVSRLTSANRFVQINAFTQAKSLSEISRLIVSATQVLQQHHRSADGREVKVTLVLDNPDICLATASTTAVKLNTFLLSVRRQVWSTILTCYAGMPLVSAAIVGPEAKAAPIESESAGFVASQAHAAGIVMSVRELDTGAAKDVSGVLRITRGGDVYDFVNTTSDEDEMREAEMLYFVQKDGTVKVFARGSVVDY